MPPACMGGLRPLPVWVLTLRPIIHVQGGGGGALRTQFLD